ncbi:MAG: NUMOD1 domain-containing DNA-binding protein [Roseburia sp.]|nr:NUMOD1 domain-containing DNA-binding protein [Roseburia sp.]
MIAVGSGIGLGIWLKPDTRFMYLNITHQRTLLAFGRKKYQVALARVIRNLLKSYLYMISRIVKVYDKATNELINEFDSIEAVAYEYDLGRETVRKSINGIDIRGDVYFRSEGESPFTNRKTKVYWYDKNTNQLLGVFDSAL